MSILSFDDLNKLTDGKYNRRSIPYEQYFGEMELTEKDKEKRIEFANDFEQFAIFLFTLVQIAQEYGYGQQKIVEQARERFIDLISKYAITDPQLIAYIDEMLTSTVGVTLDNLDDAYFMSIDRAMVIAENEANTILNYDEYKDAIAKGYKRKVWKTERDAKVRKTHRSVESEIKNIKDAFWVGDSLMQFPKDTSYGASAEEIVNCRCTIEYLK